MEKLRHDDYVLLAERTLGEQFFFNSLQDQKKLHAVTGILTELPELLDAVHIGDIVNIGEEIADIYWYASIFDRELDARFTKICNKVKGEQEALTVQMSAMMMVNNHLIDTARFFDLIKKKGFYGKELDLEKQLDFVQRTYTFLAELVNLFDLDVETILANNINKLKLRYPDRFNTINALERDTQAEREVLAKNI